MAIKNSKTTATYLEWDKMMTLIKKLEKDDEYKFMLLISLGSFFGIRISDILKLKWSDLLDKEEIELLEKKTGKYRKIKAATDLQSIITKAHKELKPKRDNQLIFLNKYGTQAFTVQYVNWKLKRIAKKYELGIDFKSHVLRKTFGRKVYSMHKNEHALLLLSELFSHKSIAVTKRYLGLREEELQSVYDKLSIY